MNIFTKEQYEFIHGCLSDLYFVNWDRFVDTEYNKQRRLRFYGWVKRDKDSYKDFVLLDIFPEDLTVDYLTSSDKVTGEISSILYGDSKDHISCQRVESIFKITNSIKLEGGNLQ